MPNNRHKKRGQQKVSWFKIDEKNGRHLRKETFQVTNIDVQVSATLTREDTPGIFIVTNNDKDSHGSAQIQDMLADFFKYFE